MDQPERGRRGRPPTPTERAKRHAVGIRTTKALKDSLQRAADSSGRSVAQEIEFRLERSFESDEFLKEVFGTSRLQYIFKTFSAMVHATAPDECWDDSWLDDPKLCRAITRQWRRHLDALCAEADEKEKDLVKLIEWVSQANQFNPAFGKLSAAFYYRELQSGGDERKRAKYRTAIHKITGQSESDLDRLMRDFSSDDLHLPATVRAPDNPADPAQ